METGKTVLDHGFVRRIEHNNDDLTVVNAARVSFGKNHKKMTPEDSRLLTYLAKNNHWTPFAHARIAFDHLQCEPGAMMRWLTEREDGWIIRQMTGEHFWISGSLWNWLHHEWPPMNNSSRGVVQNTLLEKCPVSVATKFAGSWNAPFAGGSWFDETHDLYPQFRPLTFHIKLPIFVARQWMRSNGGIVYNETSRRYVSDDPEFHSPEIWRTKPKDGIKQGSGDGEIETVPVSATPGSGRDVPLPVPGLYEETVLECDDFYSRMIRAGAAPEQARIVLPLSMFTEFWMTGTLEAFNRVIDLRANRGAENHAQWEIECYARALESVFPG